MFNVVFLFNLNHHRARPVNEIGYNVNNNNNNTTNNNVYLR